LIEILSIVREMEHADSHDHRGTKNANSIHNLARGTEKAISYVVGTAVDGWTYHLFPPLPTLQATACGFEVMVKPM
jgi:hypothetical protein